MSPLKLAVIGVGNIAETHLAAYKKNPDVVLYALCDISPERLSKMGEKYGVTRLYTDKNAMLSALPEIDVVSVCTWNSEHAPCAIAALNAGCHVLCEKPMATTVEDAIAMKAAAEHSGKLLMVGFVRRFGNDMKILREFSEAGAFGDFYYAKATYLRRNGNPGGWFGDKSRSGGGPLIDLGVHVIDFVRYAMGDKNGCPKPVSVYGATYQKLLDRKNIKSPKGYYSSSATDHDICDVEDLASAMIRFDNGATLHIEASFSLNLKKPEGKIELFGDKGGACINPELEIFSESNGYMTNVTLDAKTELSFDGLFENEINHFVAACRGKVKCASTADDGIVLMKILTGIYKSAETGHEVIIEK